MRPVASLQPVEKRVADAKADQAEPEEKVVPDGTLSATLEDCVVRVLRVEMDADDAARSVACERPSPGLRVGSNRVPWPSARLSADADLPADALLAAIFVLVTYEWRR